jgi:hypothetical protein
VSNRSKGLRIALLSPPLEMSMGGMRLVALNCQWSREDMVRACSLKNVFLQSRRC